MRSILGKTSYRMRALQCKSEVRTNTQNQAANRSTYLPNLLTLDPGAHSKTMSTKHVQRIKKWSTNTFKMGPQKWNYFQGGLSWGAIGGPIRFSDTKQSKDEPTALAKWFQGSKANQKWPQRAARVQKITPEVFNLSLARAVGLADCAKRNKCPEECFRKDVTKESRHYCKHGWACKAVTVYKSQTPPCLSGCPSHPLSVATRQIGTC